MAPPRRRLSAPDPVRALAARTRRTIAERALLKGGETVLLAVSGGADSLALMHVMYGLSRELDLSLHVAHFDHRLRAGSERDAAFVSRAAAALGLPATVRAADANETPRGLSPEEAARERRLLFLQEIAETIGAARIATAHTLDDQAETILMRVLFGTGPRGLGGIMPKRWYYVRPLIDARRAEVEAFCRALRLRPRRDPSNEDLRFLRNRIRHETIPFLERTVNARVQEALVRLGDVLRDEDVYLHGVMLEAVQLELEEPTRTRMALDVLAALPVPLQRRAIRYVAARQGLELDLHHTEAIRRLAADGETGKSVDLPGPLNATVEYGFLVLGRAPSPPVPGVGLELVVPGDTDLPPWGLRVRAWLGDEPPASWPDGRTECVLDADRVPSPLVVRRWRSGDRFRPLGMSREKKVGDFFTDEKVPKGRRGEVPIVAGADGRVVWIVGHRPDDRAKVRSTTRRYLWLSMEGATT